MKKILWTVAVIIFFISINAFSAGVSMESACESDGSCATELSALKKEKAALCEGPPLKAWWKRTRGWSIISCSCMCADQENLNWFSSGNNPSKLLSYGAYINPTYLEKNSNVIVENIYDPQKLCEPLNLNRVGKSDFILSEHVYKGAGDNNFCYGIMYGNFNNNKIEIYENGKSKELLNIEGTRIATSAEQAALNSINNKLWVSVEGGLEKIYTDEVKIEPARAYIYGAAAESEKTKSYLIKGDLIYVRPARFENPFVQFIYLKKMGL